MVKFLRRTSNRYSKLGKGRKKKQVWRKPTGRDNKMREKRKGYPAVVSVGYRTEKKSRGALKEKKPVIINNLKDLEKIKENEIAIIGKVGKKKKIEIAKKVKEMKIKIYNMNPAKFLKQIEKPKEKPTSSPKQESVKTSKEEVKKWISEVKNN